MDNPNQNCFLEHEACAQQKYVEVGMGPLWNLPAVIDFWQQVTNSDYFSANFNLA